MATQFRTTALFGLPYSPTLLTGQFFNAGEVDEYSGVSGISGTLSVTDLDLAATPSPPRSPCSPPASPEPRA
jgi:hypothetical protein